MSIWMILGLFLLVVLNLLATVAVTRSTSLRFSQRVFQVALVWLLPFVGAIIIWAFVTADRSPRFDGSSSDLQTYAGDITTLDQGPSPCGCSEAGGGDD
jgi:hypothetical protein